MCTYVFVYGIGSNEYYWVLTLLFGIVVDMVFIIIIPHTHTYSSHIFNLQCIAHCRMWMAGSAYAERKTHQNVASPAIRLIMNTRISVEMSWMCRLCRTGLLCLWQSHQPQVVWWNSGYHSLLNHNVVSGRRIHICVVFVCALLRVSKRQTKQLHRLRFFFNILSSSVGFQTDVSSLRKHLTMLDRKWTI